MIYMKFLVLRILSILSFFVPLYCNALFFFLSSRYLLRCTRPLQFVSGSVFFYDKNLCFRWPVPPLLRFHDLYFHRCQPLSIIHFWITVWSLIRLYRIHFFLYLDSDIPRLSACRLTLQSSPRITSPFGSYRSRYIQIVNYFLMAHWSIPPYHVLFYYFQSGFWTLPVHWPIPLSFYFLSEFFLSPLVRTSLVLFFLGFSSTCPLAFTPLS